MNGGSSCARSAKAASASVTCSSLLAKSCAPEVSEADALGLACISVMNDGTGRDFISTARTESRMKSCSIDDCRKRTSVFDGCTFTSTSVDGISRNSSTTG